MTDGCPISCLIVDDHHVVRQGLASLLAGTQDIELMGGVGSGEAALRILEEHQPSVAVMDVRLPGIDGIDTVKRLAESAPEVGTIVFSAYGDRGLIADALAAGARGYVMKGSPADDLTRAIRIVDAGGTFIDPSLAPAMLMKQEKTGSPLSRRELEVLQLLADGLHTHEAAERIGVAEHVAKWDIKTAARKLDAGGRVQAVATALRAGLVQ